MENKLDINFVTNEGYNIKIIEYINAKNCTIRFEDGSTRSGIQYDKIKKGKVKHYNHLSIFSIGKIGYGKYNSKTHFNYYKIWKRVLERCCRLETKEKQPTYKDVIVCEEWYNFQNFAEWVEQNYNPETMQGWHLDKDILIKRNKIYSPDTCCFVPREINNLFPKADSIRGEYPIGISKIRNLFQVFCCINSTQKFIGLYITPEEAFQAYKTTKESHIKEVADKWKDLIDPKVYQAMNNYEVEITD